MSVALLIAVCSLIQDPAPPPPQTAADWTASGNRKIDSGDLSGAAVDYSKAIELDPKHAPAWNGRGVARERKGDLDGAIADFTKALELDQNEYFHRNRASARRAKGDLKGAITDLSRAIAIKPIYVDAYIARGTARFAADDLEGSLSDFRTAIQLAPRNSDVYRGMAHVKKDEGDYDGALSSISKAIELSPESASLYSSRGLIRSCRGESMEALKDYGRALELKPGDMSIHYFRGCALADDGKWAAALIDFKKAADLSSPQWEFPRLRIWLAKSRLGDRVAATQELEGWLAARKAPANDQGSRVAAFLTGSLKEPEFLKQVETDKTPGYKSARCQAYFVAGQKRLLDGDKFGARNLFKQAVATEARNWRDYGSAAAELRLLDK